MTKNLPALLFLGCFPALGQVSVQLVFANGDKLSGDLKRVDGDAIEVSPTTKSLGDLVTIKWTDGVVEMQMKSKESTEACLYGPVGAPGTTSAALCFQTAVASKGAAPGISITGVAAAKQSYASLDTTAPAPPQPTMVSQWGLTLSAPESIVQGTQSQQTLGGILVGDVYFRK